MQAPGSACILEPCWAFWNLLKSSETFWNLLEPSEVFWKLLKPIGTFWNLLETSGTFWNLRIPTCLLPSLCNCMQAHESTCILHTFWNILHTFWNILEHENKAWILSYFDDQGYFWKAKNLRNIIKQFFKTIFMIFIKNKAKNKKEFFKNRFSLSILQV